MKYLGKAYEKLDVQPGDVIKNKFDGKEYITVSLLEVKKHNFSGHRADEKIYYKFFQEGEVKYSYDSPDFFEKVNKIFPELKKGIQSGAGAVVADELVKLVHKYYGKHFPSWWIKSKMAMDVEPFVIPIVIYFTSLFAGNLPLVEKLSLFAIRGKTHDLTKSLWIHFRSMFKELYEISKEK